MVGVINLGGQLRTFCVKEELTLGTTVCSSSRKSPVTRGGSKAHERLREDEDPGSGSQFFQCSVRVFRMRGYSERVGASWKETVFLRERTSGEGGMRSRVREMRSTVKNMGREREERVRSVLKGSGPGGSERVSCLVVEGIRMAEDKDQKQLAKMDELALLTGSFR
ncbi:hypothetical protein COLO4_19826 [Corchorus olitorius]|uniref:Uncharacterized protein n=1 Tax=Corchorus olitorius TaxID=93759 RepID=A0A1R3J376_9ROSI|nr:hypothetical protein COLO4_19826 [Corchorus olitorius]